MRIFISVASYLDVRLWPTVIDAYQKAKHKSGLHFAIIDQSQQPQVTPAELASARISYLFIPAKDSRGVCWARHLAQSFYDDEDFFLQIDSHMCFEEHWDDRLAWELEQLPSKKALVTTYPSRFELREGKMVPFPEKDVVLALQVRKEENLTQLSPILRFYAHPYKNAKPMQGYQVAGGCLFTRGSFIHEVPYDPHLYFLGEEQAITIRAYTNGWDIYHTSNVPIYHLYRDTGSTEARSPMHWDAVQGRTIDWNGLNKRAIARLYSLLYDQRDLGVYGLGKERSIADFAEFSGIDYMARKITKRPY
jgi:hypothetical protein